MYFAQKRVFFLIISQLLGEFLCSTPEMKARDAYVPFLLSKPINKNRSLKLFCESFERIAESQIEIELFEEVPVMYSLRIPKNRKSEFQSESSSNQRSPRD